MFLENKYTSWYYSIIDRAKSRILDDNIYIEKHHIIPKSIGGSNRKDNLIILTAKEHFICHLLLIKMTSNEQKAKMVYAAWAMANLKKEDNTREKITGKTYSFVRELVSKQHAEWRTGQKHTEETKKKQRKPKNFNGQKHHLKDISRTQKVKDKISATLTNKPKSEEHKRNMSEAEKDRTKFRWSHSENGDLFCSIWDIMKNFPDLNKVGLRHVIYKYQSSHRGWKIKEE